MALAVRQKGSRRFDIPVEFPLMDYQEIIVIKDRRQLTDRRMSENYLDVLKIMLSKMTEK
jgi:hypothetical protein